MRVWVCDKLEGWEFISFKTGGFRWYKNWFIWIRGQIFEFWRHIFEFGRCIFEFWRHTFEFWKLQEVGISIFYEHRWGGGLVTNQWHREVFSYKEGGFWWYKNSRILNLCQILEFWRHVVECWQNSRWTFFPSFKSDIHVPPTILGMDRWPSAAGRRYCGNRKSNRYPPETDVCGCAGVYILGCVYTCVSCINTWWPGVHI